MKIIIPQIHIKDCKSALEFYKSVFGGEIENVQYAEGKEMFQGMEGQIIHSELHINENCIVYINSVGQTQSGNVDILLQLETEEEIGLIYDALGADGEVIVKLDKQFWGDFHGVVKDKYGIIWGLNYSEKNN